MEAAITKINPLGTERVGKLMMRYAVPSIISIVVNSLYNMVDQVFIGQGVGYLGNAATNVIMPISTIMLALGFMFGDGAAAFMSLHLGKKEPEKAAKGIGNVTRGEVRVGGVPVKDYDMASLRDSVAVVLQKNVLFSGTIKENLRWGKEDATDDEIINVCRLAQADEFIRDFPAGYDTHIERGGANVSGGQKQRLCIARALLKKPKILILDDSTSAVDTKTDALIRRAFREKIPDTTKIIIAQRISSIQDADRILVFDNGRMKSVGTHEELLESSPIYREIYESQTKEGGDDDSRE